MLTLEEIRDLCPNVVTFNNAKRLYRLGSIKHMSAFKERDGYEVHGTIEEDKYHQVETIVRIFDDGRVRVKCGCHPPYGYWSICEHGAALLMEFWERLQTGTIKIQPIEQIYGMEMLAFYEEEAIRKMQKNREGYIRVQPKLYKVWENVYGVGLQVGEDRLYIVKDIMEFVDAILKEEQLGYGKNLAFIHHVGAFCEQDRPLIEWIVDEAVARQATLDQMSGRLTKLDKKYIALTPGGFDKFFELMEGRTISYYDDSNEEITLVKDNPKLYFDVAKEEEQFVLTSNLNQYSLIEYPKNKYIIIEDKLYKCNKNFADNVMPILDYMNQMHTRQFYFDERGWQRFVLTILPRIKRYVELHIEEGLLARYTPPELVIKTYLDKDGSNNIVEKTTFTYGVTTFNPYDTHGGEPVDLARDITKEHAYTNILENYQFKNNKGQLHLDDEESIYNFLTYGIDELLPISEVHITDELKAMKFRKPLIGSVGIKIESDLLKVNFEEINLTPEEIDAIMEAYHLKKKYYRLRSGSFIDVGNREVDQLAQIMEGLRLGSDAISSGEVTLPKYRALYLDQITKQNEDLSVERDKYFKQIIRDVKNVADADFEVPTFLKKTLRGYQKVGYRWLRTMAAYGFGGILADDMGLGKTLQVITLLAAQQNRGYKQNLVVAPTSLVLNWQKEIEKFTPHLKVLVLNGTIEERKEKLKHIEGYDILITSYDLLKRDIELYESLHFKYCIADEAHYIKNPNTQNAKALKCVRSEVRFALTGTPIENTLAELWSIFDFIMPGYLFSYQQFKGSFETPILKFESERATNQLRTMVAPFILRRLKKDVLKELPEKTETILYNEMTPEQEKIYKANLALLQQEFQKEMKLNGISRSHIKILAMLTRLRQLCCHPGLYLDEYEGGSSKLDQCIELIEDSIESGHKILLFSQFTTMLDKIAYELQVRGISYYMLTGATKAERRIEMVELFNKDATPIFLISLKAGGTGLNLTGADIVIHYDPWWNVSSENQATDRAHRIGQKNNVQVFKLITQNTIEEKIKKLQDKKIGLSDQVLTGEQTFISHMSEEEIKDLFKLD
ncbi:MAG: SNF2 helicase associated domain-containing protein [Clostridiales bacterium]|nr:SNF2 helicase associated domain-containing protein [Clostridiales bacterium]